MKDFQVFVRDDRYSVPTLHVITAADNEGALELARLILSESDHHKGVEVRQGEKLLFAIGEPLGRAFPPSNP